mmetsp:Transcript_20164/g.33433  ORF Transcript_20164/g.33433 Transcript_20164/m.33433 type:complete len:288 (-) Transcript_20164:209-1072(-)|eukprot:CAMPEP_0119003704 /NCGR_PEP_ID=MMETSP1176-20130426/721_1 /TAXON_ID=265551 /ORGANISM="Synedropsis recta cf, Strain CCMP1620" /LENGTH=287 /DNA_ID=CAMNT_0006955327 /DNA_START=63 /DNA_END=926 /DNA_ORIENTATION=+
MIQDSSTADAKAKLEEARKNVTECDKEMQMLKRKIRELGTDTGGDPNSLELVVLKVEGLPEEAKPTFSLQLSSPIEEQPISKLFDPLEPTAEGSVAMFQGVETSNATLTVSAKDADIPLGSSETMDVAPLCKIADVSQPQCVTETQVSILAEGEGDKEAAVIICTATVKVTYKASAKDQREELYELLNKASQKKAQHMVELQQAARLAHRSSVATQPGPAVQRGFLNKAAAKKKEPNKWLQWMQRNVGPNSRLVSSILPAVKNYVIFFGVAAVFHFKGQALSLPPPL